MDYYYQTINQLSVIAKYGLTKNTYGFLVYDLIHCFEIFRSLNASQRNTLVMSLFYLLEYDKLQPSIDAVTMAKLSALKALCSSMRYLAAPQVTSVEVGRFESLAR